MLGHFEEKNMNNCNVIAIVLEMYYWAVLYFFFFNLSSTQYNIIKVFDNHRKCFWFQKLHIVSKILFGQVKKKHVDKVQ